MSQIFLMGIVILLNHLLPLIGLSWGDSQVGLFAQNIVDIGAAAWLMFRRYQVGDINTVGKRL